MKTNALLAFFFLLFTLFTFTRAEYVFDSDGKVLANAGKYYLSPPDPIGGGYIVAVEIKEDDTCFLAVAQKLYTHGWPVIIAAPLNVPNITTDYNLGIAFADLPANPCTKTPDWIVTKTAFPGLGETVMVGSDKEYPNYVYGWFFINSYDRVNHYYTLSFCQEGGCGFVGTENDSENNKRLVIYAKDPLVFKFDKVKEDVASDI